MSKVISKILIKILKSEGLRYTDQRQAIWDEIRNSNEHRDAEDIYLKLKERNVNIGHCPKVYLRRGYGLNSLQKLINHNVNVGIGTDA